MKQQGTLVANSYLAIFEETPDGRDFQDIVVVLHNVQPYPPLPQITALTTQQQVPTTSIIPNNSTNSSGNNPQEDTTNPQSSINEDNTKQDIEDPLTSHGGNIQSFISLSIVFVIYSLFLAAA